MTVLAIIAEYNPFHKGHEYHIKKSIERVNPDFVICLLSGNFTQRGEPAIINKWERSKWPLEAGVDLVLELPFVFACNSAEYFALGSITLLNKLGCVTHLSFGSECGDIQQIKEVAKLLHQESDEFKKALKFHLKQGVSYPFAREKALKAVLGKETQILSNPNNILGVEYVKALLKTQSDITPITLLRKGSGYKSQTIEVAFPSAMAIRNHLKLKESNQYIFSEDFFSLIKYKLLTETEHELKKVVSINEGLENRLKKALIKGDSLENFLKEVYTKRYTETRVNRILYHALMNLTDEKLKEFTSKDAKYQSRILSFTDKGATLIKKIKQKENNENLLVTQINKEPWLVSKQHAMLAQDVMASQIYNIIVEGKG